MSTRNHPRPGTTCQETPIITGRLAKTFADRNLPLQVLRSGRGYYLGTSDQDGPVSRESVEYFSQLPDAQHALDTGNWTQREAP